MQAHERTAFCDKLKLQLNDISEAEAQEVRGKIARWLEANLENPAQGYVESIMRKCVYKPYTWKENGRTHRGYSYEWTGIVADTVLMAMPLSWYQFITYMHSKVYLHSVNKEVYKELANRSSDAPMFRNVSKLGPRRHASDKDFSRVPGLRIGSNKSDLQVLWYQDSRSPVGMESRLKDEKLKRLLQRYVAPNPPSSSDRVQVWQHFLVELYKEGQDTNAKIAAGCGLHDELDELGQPLTAAQLAYYFLHLAEPVFDYNNNLVNPSGFMPIPENRREFYGERQYEFFEEFSHLGITDGMNEAQEY